MPLGCGTAETSASHTDLKLNVRSGLKIGLGPPETLVPNWLLSVIDGAQLGRCGQFVGGPRLGLGWLVDIAREGSAGPGGGDPAQDARSRS